MRIVPMLSRTTRQLLVLLGAVALAALVVALLQEWPTRRSYPDIAPSAEPNYSQIEERLWIGGYVREPPAATEAVLNVCESEDPYQAKAHDWQPIPDTAPAPSFDWLIQRVAFVAAQQQAGRSTYVHCHAGISRSGMVVLAYLMQKHRWTRDEALAFVRTKRPQVGPNPAFMELLLEWEKSILAR